MANQKTKSKKKDSAPPSKAKKTQQTSSNKSKATQKQLNEKQRAAKKQKNAIIIMASAIILFAITLIKGESVWQVLHNFVFRIFGICAFAWPIMLIYLAVVMAINKPFASAKYNAVGIGGFILLLEGIIHVAWGNASAGNIGEQIKAIWLDMKIPSIKSGGLIGTLVGGGMEALMGKAGALIIMIVVDVVILMLLTGTTLVNAYNAVYKPVKKVKTFTDERIENGIERQRKRKESTNEPFDVPVKKKSPFNEVKLGPDPSPAIGKEKESDTIYIEELAGNAIQEQEEEKIEEQEPKSLDDIIKEMQTVNAPAPIESVDIKKVEPKAPKEEKPKAEPQKPISVEAPVSKEVIEDEPETEYQKPNLECLNTVDNSGAMNYEQEVKLNAQKLEDTLHSFDVNAKMVGICRGPSVTRYELSPAPGVKISKITSLSDDIALAMAATGVRMEAPIPGKAAVGIEIPNKTRATVSLREIFESPAYNTQVSKSKLSVALGKNITGEAIMCDVAKMPHMLIAGTTGSGKSVCLNSMIISILYNATPDEVKLLMIDPKQVEFTVYNGIPHLLVPVVADPKKAAGALGWAVTEMLKRYKLFSENNVRDIKGYNRLARLDETMTEMPQIVIFIDELSDLMMAAKKEVEDSICRLAQMARAAGMHLVIATQRPSVDVITGIIKANIPSRIALSVSSQVDSRTILDTAGAETLLGNGDMLYAPIGVSKPIRVQGCFVSDSEVENVVNFIKQQHTGTYDDAVNSEIEDNAKAIGEKKKAAVLGSDDDGDGDGEADEMLPKAIEVVVESQMASTTLLQRKLKLGYARAARLMDSLEERGIVGPFEGSKPRKVLISREQWMEMNALGNASPARETPYGEEN